MQYALRQRCADAFRLEKKAWAFAFGPQLVERGPANTFCLAKLIYGVGLIGQLGGLPSGFRGRPAPRPKST